MAPPNPPAEPTQPPKREPAPTLIPTVGLGKDQVILPIILFVSNILFVQQFNALLLYSMTLFLVY